MLMMLKIMVFLIIAYFIPYLLGMLFTYLLKENNHTISKNILSGYAILWGFLQIITIPAIYLKLSFSLYSLIIYISMLIAAICSFILNRKRILYTVKDVFLWLKSKPWLMLGVILFIFVQTLYLSLANLVDFDDAFFVATAETALETNTLMEYNPYTGALYTSFPSRYVLSPFPMFTALFSKLIDVRAATTAHTLLILILIPLAYMVWYQTGNELYEKHEKKTAIFMLIIMCIIAFSGYSVYNQGMFMTVRIWQGKAILASILLPFIFCIGLRIIKKEMGRSDWILLFFLMLSSCFVSSMGIMLAVIMLGVIALSDSIIHKGIQNWWKIILCCIPNILYALIYIIIR